MSICMYAMVCLSSLPTYSMYHCMYRIYLSIYLSICLSIYLSVYLSVCLSVYLSASVSASVSVSVTVCESIYAAFPLRAVNRTSVRNRWYGLLLSHWSPWWSPWTRGLSSPRHSPSSPWCLTLISFPWGDEVKKNLSGTKTCVNHGQCL